MTREEAKKILTHNWTRVDNPNYSESELDEALDMAIEALQYLQEWGDVLQGKTKDCKNCKAYEIAMAYKEMLREFQDEI